MNTTKLVNHLYENLNAVQVVFDGCGKHYTYKTFDAYEVGDKCIVDSPYTGYTVVDVVGTDRSVLEEDHQLKFVVQKVDDRRYIELRDNERQLVQQLSSAMLAKSREDAIDRLKELVGLDTVETLKASANKNIACITQEGECGGL